MDTIDPIVVSGPPAPAPVRGRRRRWPFVVVPVAVLLVVFAIAGSVSVPYYAVAPGGARQVNDLIRVPRERAFPPQGRILLATVALRQVTALEAMVGWLDGDVDVVPEEEILGSATRNQFSRQNRELMDDSKQLAAVVALRHLGYPVPEHGTGTQVVATEEGSPAHGRVRPDEVITAVDGRPTPLASELVRMVRARGPGQTVRLDVSGPQGARTEAVVLGSTPRRPGGYLGVFVRTRDQRFDFPFQVRIESGDIGGPSAGLAFTLGMLDSLTTGELTGGKKVAATGTIDTDGSVGNVGGVAQKTAAVRSAGARYFLVPPGEYAEAQVHAGDDLVVLKAANLSEALTALAGVGGDVSPSGAPRRPVS